MTSMRIVVGAVVAALAIGGCGGDEGGAAPKSETKKPAADAKKKADADKKKKADADKKKKAKKIEAVSFIPTLERSVEGDEAKTIRRRLRETDFAPDDKGVTNRDPFRSYVLPQVPGGETPAAGTSTTVTAKPTETCTKTKMVATNYALRDLSLIGIVSRGATRYALFRDTGGVGHMVERGKCVAREKAIVTEIGEGHVTVEIVPEQMPGGPEPVAERRSIPLYANELTVESLDEAEEQGPPPGSQTAPVVPPPSPAPTTTPAPPPAPPTTP